MYLICEQFLHKTHGIRVKYGRLKVLENMKLKWGRDVYKERTKNIKAEIVEKKYIVCVCVISFRNSSFC